MKFLKLKIMYREIEKEFSFSEKVNLVFSKTNSVGKSTLLRLLFYAMGYSIPSTKGIDFTKVLCELSLENNKGKMVLRRSNKKIELKTAEASKLFILPDESEELHALIFDSTNKNVVDNIIGSIYLDQEKGWTLLNKGIVIGKIKFDLKRLVAGLANRDIKDLEAKLSTIRTKIKKYQAMLSIYDYNTHYGNVGGNKSDGESNDYVDELERALDALLVEKNRFDKQIKDIELSLKDNVRFVEYIEAMKLFVKDGEKEIQVTKSNLVNFEDSQGIIESRKKILESRAKITESKIAELKENIEEQNRLLDVQTQLEKFDNQVSRINIDSVSVGRIISKLKVEQAKVKNNIDNVIINNNDVINNLYFTITKYASELGVSKYMDESKDYIFTKDLKGLSGAVYHKIVFIFKIAYIIEIQKYLKIELPIVLDSPTGREVDRKNIENIVNILNRDFKKNQIIIASIYDDYKFDNISKLQIKNGLFKDSL